MTEKIIEEELTSVLDKRFITYAYMSLEDRALPDARDGLKPSQRRILVAMHDLGLVNSGVTEKCAKICGTCSGDYHPHGEAIVYPTLCRLVQPWVMNAPLVSGQGNFGNVDGDPPAAMRYVGAKLSAVGETLLQDLNPDTVLFIPNYNEKKQEPTVLPAKFPNLLVNGAEGIAVGWATKLPPHNLSEVVEAIKLYINNKKVTAEDILTVMPGPDFPTGGKLLGQEEVLSYYKTGKGQLKIEGKWTINKNSKGIETITITELPYQSSPEGLLTEIEDLVKNDKISGINDLKNLSSKEGIKIVIECSRGTNSNLLLNNLLKNTSLRRSFSVNQTVLIDGKVVPDVTVLQLIETFVAHRTRVLTNKYTSEQAKHQNKIPILDALIRVANRIDETIKIIRNSTSPEDASKSLIQSQICQDEIQAKAVLAITLSQLTKLEQNKLLDEKKKREDRIAWINKILSDPKEIDKLIIKEQEELVASFGKPRKTQIIKNVKEISEDDLIEDKQLFVYLTGDEYIISTVEEFNLLHFGKVNIRSKDIVLFFTNKGMVYRRKGFEIPETNRNGKGTHASAMLGLAENEHLIGMVKWSDKGYIISITSKGLIKRTEIAEYESGLKTAGLVGIKLNDNDSVVTTLFTDGKQELFIATEQGMCVRYNESIVPCQGRATQGSRAMKLTPGDSIIQMISINDKHSIVVITQKGFGKKTVLSEYKSFDNRQIKGYLLYKVVLKNGSVAGISAVNKEDYISIWTKGKAFKISPEDIKETGRHTSGICIVNLENDNSIVKLHTM